MSTGTDPAFVVTAARRPATAAEAARLLALAGGHFAGPAGAAVVAVDRGEDGALIAIYACAQERARHWLCGLWVDPSVRRRGLASWIVRERIDEAIRAGVPLVVEGHPEQGIAKLCRKLGFVAAPTTAGRLRGVFSL